MTTTRDDPKLRNPEADALREALAKAAGEISEALGIRYIDQSVTDWFFHHDAWRISYTWLIAADGGALKPGEYAAENLGFRVTVQGRQCVLEMRSRVGQLSFKHDGYIGPDRAAFFLGMGFA